MTHQKPNSDIRDKMGTILFKAMEETIGREDLIAALRRVNKNQPEGSITKNSKNHSLQFTDISEVHAALEKIYGLRGSQGLALRSGRACFKYGLREFGDQWGFTDIDFRLLPLNIKIITAAEQFAASLSEVTYKQVEVEEDSNNFLFHIKGCPICWGRHSKTAICHMTIGLLQEALYWISGGKHFHIEETDCIAKGDLRCTLVIQKQPLE
jgi:predicted hydrocarbon binding protein